MVGKHLLPVEQQSSKFGMALNNELELVMSQNSKADLGLVILELMFLELLV